MKNKHLANLERLEIVHSLRQRTSLKKIAAKHGNHHSTLSRTILSRGSAGDKGCLWKYFPTAMSGAQRVTTSSST